MLGGKTELRRVPPGVEGHITRTRIVSEPRDISCLAAVVE
jgi:hypothetical protein